LEEAVERILTATHKAGKKAGFFATSGEQSKKYADKGFDMISVALDTTALQATLAVSLSTARGLGRPKTGGTY
jgi:4-hydroxy-2-oxoheptanedioate aldolase